MASTRVTTASSVDSIPEVYLAGMSLRQHPELRSLFFNIEARHPTESELRLYCEVVPECTHRARAARDVARVEDDVVKQTVAEVFIDFPFEQHHPQAYAKCIRDVKQVSIYATQTMLMDDPDWFEEKLLLWLRSILQAFNFPARQEPKPGLLARIGQRFSKPVPPPPPLPDGRDAIHATYSLLYQLYQETLSADTFKLMDAPLRQAVDILPADGRTL